MKKPLTIGAAAVASIALAAAAVFFLVGAYAGPSYSDPETARCNAPPVTFDGPRMLSDHREVEVHFTCAGAVLAGTVFLPNGAGPHPAVVWVHGSGRGSRWTWRGTPLVRSLVHAGVAILYYDKRGDGASKGVCCPGNSGQFNLLAADAVGAVNALRSRTDIRGNQVGLLGGSQAGWIVPLAAVRSESRVAFTALVDAPTVSFGEEDLYSGKTGDKGLLGKVVWVARTVGGLRTPGPSGFDPRPSLNRMTVPGLWLYGGEDMSQPTGKDVAVLKELQRHGKDFTFVVYPKAGHGLLDLPPTDPRALPAVVGWISATTRASEAAPAASASP